MGKEANGRTWSFPVCNKTTKLKWHYLWYWLKIIISFIFNQLMSPIDKYPPNSGTTTSACNKSHSVASMSINSTWDIPIRISDSVSRRWWLNNRRMYQRSCYSSSRKNPIWGKGTTGSRGGEKVEKDRFVAALLMNPAGDGAAADGQALTHKLVERIQSNIRRTSRLITSIWFTKRSRVMMGWLSDLMGCGPRKGPRPNIAHYSDSNEIHVG